jgi:hypothetical protein
MQNEMPAEILRNIIPILAIGGGLVFAVIATIVGAIRAVALGRAREQSRREVAAYVAEGTMSPDDAAKILSAGNSIRGKCGC